MTASFPFETRAAEAYRDRDVMVLGASGFIGRWVARALALAGARLTLPVRAPDSSRRVFDSMGIRGEILRLDLGNFDAVGTVLSDARPSVVFNAAGYGVDRSERDPGLAQILNADLVNVLCQAQAAIDDDWPGLRLVHVGSALEYGVATGDLNESTTADPTTLYGRTKLAGTRHVQRECEESGLRGVVARLFTVYGPGEHQGRLFPALVLAAKEGRALPLTAGRQERDFAYVEDVATGLLSLGAMRSTRGPLVNLATGKLLSVRDFALQTAQVLRLDARLLGFGQVPVREEEMEHKPVNIKRLKMLLGWSPPADILSGVERSLTWV